MTFDLTSQSGEASSVVLTGDNGTGKSSIVDALEFCLQGRILRSSHFSDPAVPAAISFSSKSLPCVRVFLSSGEEISRCIRATEDAVLFRDPQNPHKFFSLSPFVLRRADILQFWLTPEIRRQMMLFDFFRPNSPEHFNSAPPEMVRILEDERIALKKKRREIAEQLALLQKIDVKDIPLDQQHFDSFARETIYAGMTRVKRKRAEWKGVKVSINPKLDALCKAMRTVNSQIARVESQISSEKKGPPRTDFAKRHIREALANIGATLTDSFSRISSSKSFVERFEVGFGELTEISLGIRVFLKNGMCESPLRVFSEANLDLIALLFFLAIVKDSAQRGQARLLVLDDVLQSVDQSIRLRLAEYLLQEFSGWQLFLTVHDRLWQEQLRELLRRFNHRFVEREILRWQFDIGPTVVGVIRNLDTALKQAVDQADVVAICSEAGLLLERISGILSYTLPISVVRRRRDRYTLGDLWPGVAKILKRTTISGSIIDIDRLLHLRNLVGAHYNEWAMSLPLEDANCFGVSVLRLFEAVYCRGCSGWIEVCSETRNKSYWQCRCRSIRIEDRTSGA